MHNFGCINLSFYSSLTKDNIFLTADCIKKNIMRLGCIPCMVDLLDISLEGIFLLTVLATLVFVVISLFNIQKGVNSSKTMSLSSPVIYLGLFVIMLFALIKFYEYSKKLKQKQSKEGEGKIKWLKGQ